MPEPTIAAPAAPAAPSAPAPSAPAAAPAPAAPDSTAAPVAAPESTSTPVATPEPAAASAAATSEAAASAKPEPKRGDYEDSAAGIEKFLKEHNAWEAEQQGQPELVTGDEIQVDSEKTAEEAAAAETKEEPASAEEASKTAEVESPTPEALSKLAEAHPALKDVMEANPEVKGALYQMARVNAKAAPILEIFPNVESAKFAQDSAGEFVGLKTAIQLSDSPEKMADAATMFLDQFKILDDKGEPVLDAGGQPTYGEDLNLFVDHIKGRDRSVRIADLKARIAADKYTSPDGKDNDQQLLDAYEFIATAESADPDSLDEPDTSNLSPEVKAYLEREKAKLAEEREKLGLKDKELTQKGRTEQRARMDTQYRQTFGANTGKYMGNYLKQKADAGVVIPEYLLTMKDPKTGVSVFAQQAFDRLNAAIKADPLKKSTAARLEMQAINEQGLAARVANGQELIDNLLPGIIDGLLKEAGVSFAETAKKAAEARDAKRTDARTEPATSGRSNPQKMSDEQIMAKAKAEVEAEHAGKYLDPAKKIQLVLERRNKLEAQ